jgi:hypothetical protein
MIRKVVFGLLPVLVCLSFQAPVLVAQEDPAFAGYSGMIMRDSSIADFIAMSKLEGVFTDKNNALGYLQRTKKYSLEIRLKQTEASQRTVMQKIKEAEAKLQNLVGELQKCEAEAQAKSSVYSTSMVAADQLLLAAQLELQKVTWELASEQELFESVVKEEANSPTRANELERELAQIDLQSVQSEMQFAEKELAAIQLLEKQGAANASDGSKAKLSATKARNALRVQELRLLELESRQAAQKNAQSAGVKSQIRKLAARKNQIEKYMIELFASIQDLNRRERIMAQIERTQKLIAANELLRDQLESKTEELQALLEQVSAVNLNEKK